jgi:hypothetical protein
VVQRVACVILVLIGLYLAVLTDSQSDTRLFGWVIVLLGFVGLVLSVVLPRRRQDR